MSLELASLPPSCPPCREQGDSVAGTAQHAQQWQWGLPTESMRVPASSLEVRCCVV